jgi:DNA-directed RNA polymerase specialized sigma24 family protein
LASPHSRGRFRNRVSEVLEKLGLTAEQVRAAFGTKREKVVIDRKNYLYAHDQRRIRMRLRAYEGFIYARFEEGLHPGTIARLLSVSEEAIRSRLRKAGFFKRGKPGRPPKKISQ